MDTINSEHFFNWLKFKKLSDRTLKEYYRYYKQFDDKPLNQTNVDCFFDGSLVLKNPLTLKAGEDIKFKNNNLVGRAFIKITIEYIKKHNPELYLYVKDIDIPEPTGRSEQKLLDYLKEDEVIKFSESFNNEMYSLMVLCSFYMGLRVSELCNDYTDYAIRPYSFNWNLWLNNPAMFGICKVTGKGKKQREVYLPQQYMKKLHIFIRDHLVKIQPKEYPLFNISIRRWTQILKDAAAVNFNRHIKPHLFRHSCNMYLKYVLHWEDHERQLYLGHSSITSTTKYDHTTRDDIRLKYAQTINN